jgi:hypothetical protein
LTPKYSAVLTVRGHHYTNGECLDFGFEDLYIHSVLFLGIQRSGHRNQVLENGENLAVGRVFWYLIRLDFES